MDTNDKFSKADIIGKVLLSLNQDANSAVMVDDSFYDAIGSSCTVCQSGGFMKKYQDLDLSNAFLFAVALEAQNDDEKNLPKRSRYYQAELDASSLKPGEDYNKLEPSYIIFICTFDPFGKGLYCYTFEERCLECDIPLGDGTKKIFLNTKGKKIAQVSEELVHFLGYMEQSTDKYVENIPENSIRRIHERGQEIKQWRRMEERYMTMEELVQDRERKSHREGVTQAVLDLLLDIGQVPEELEAQIKSEKNTDILRSWVKLAAKSDSIEEFISKIQ